MIGAIQPSDFAEPSPREVAALIDQIRATSTPAIFGSEVFPSPVLEQIGRETGVRYVDELRDDDPPGEPGSPENTYVGMLQFDVQLMAEALGGDPAPLDSLDPTNTFPSRRKHNHAIAIGAADASLDSSERRSSSLTTSPAATTVEPVLERIALSLVSGPVRRDRRAERLRQDHGPARDARAMADVYHGAVRFPAAGQRAGGLGSAYVPQLETIDWSFPVTVEQVVLMGLAAESGPFPGRGGRSAGGCTTCWSGSASATARSATSAIFRAASSSASSWPGR